MKIIKVKYLVKNYAHEAVYEAKYDWEAEAMFIRDFYPTVLDDDLPDLEIEIIMI